jgi:hypothetical protein
VNVIRQRVSSWWILLATGLLLLTAGGCTSKSSKASHEGETKQSTVANDPLEHRFDGGTYCVQTFIQGPPPPQPLHFSNKITESNQSLKSKDFEADLSGDTLDIIHHDRWLATDDDRKSFEESRKYDDPKIIVRAINDGFADETVTNHFTRSDQAGWRGGITVVAQGGTPWGLFIYKPPVSRVGSENINGYETIKYAVDTTHESQAEKAAGMLRQLKDYNIAGTAWVLKDVNCVLQYNIDDEQVGTDGKVSKTHYEGTVTKK